MHIPFSRVMQCLCSNLIDVLTIHFRKQLTNSPHGNDITEKLHVMVKHFSSDSANRKKCDSELEEHRCLSTTQLEQDHNGTRIVAAHRLLKLALRLKTGTHLFSNKFNMLSFLTDKERKTAGEFEAIIRETSRLTAIFHNEEKLNGVCGTVVRKFLHDRLSRGTMCMINDGLWSGNE